MKRLLKYSLIFGTAISLTACDLEEIETTEVEQAEVEQAEVETEKVLITDEERDILEILDEELGWIGYFDYDYVEQSYNLYITDVGMADEITAYLNQGLYADGWYNFVNSFTILSGGIADSIGDGYAVKVFHPYDDTLVIIHVEDGEIVYSE